MMMNVSNLYFLQLSEVELAFMTPTQVSYSVAFKMAVFNQKISVNWQISGILLNE